MAVNQHLVKGWTELSNPPSYIKAGNITQINDSEFMIATRKHPRYNYDQKRSEDDARYGFYIFNANAMKWKLWMEYPQDWFLRVVQLMFDKNRNQIHLWHVRDFFDDGQLKFIDFETKKYEDIPQTTKVGGVIQEHAVDIKDEIHFIGSWQGTRHVKFDKNSKKFQEIHEWKRFYGEYPMIGILTVYVPSRDVILIFGGQRNNYNAACADILEFSLKTTSWKKIENITFDYYKGQALLTMDEKYILLIPSKMNDSDDSDVDNDDHEVIYRCTDIFIFEILDDGGYKLRKSKMKLPDKMLNEKSERMIVLTGNGDKNKLLVVGFVRYVFIKNDMVIPSEDIIRLIQSFYDSEMLHVITTSIYNNERNEHFMIDVTQILEP